MTETKGLTGSTLKIIAMLSMLIDHIGASVLLRWMLANPQAYFNSTGYLKLTPFTVCYYATRCIGRIAFPIFIYLIIIGMQHTRNPWKYCGRMLLFSIISEIPFDCAFELKTKDISKGIFLEFGYQNVYFTLTIGILVITLLKILFESEFRKNHRFIGWISICMIIASGMLSAWYLHTDYGQYGVLAIVIGYLLERCEIQNKTLKKAIILGTICITLCAASRLELVALIGIWPICYYNGKRGINCKWGFYFFYPVHCLILAVICYSLGI